MMRCAELFSIGILIVLTIFLIKKGQGQCPDGTCLKKHKYGAEAWISLTAQAETLEHGCGNIPSRIDLQTRPIKGPNTDFVFPGLPSSQRDDDVNSTYGGVVYYYWTEGAKMIPPRKNKNDAGYASGKTIFTGSPFWSGPTMQSTDTSETRIRVWCECDLPKPDVTSNWMVISNKSGQNFHEFEHGLGREPELVTVVVDLGNTYYCDGIGSMTALPNTGGSQYSWGGVIFGYNESHVRIWAPSKNGGALFSVKDGWGVQDSFDIAFSGQFQVKVWSKVTNTHVKRFTITQNDKGREVDLPVPVDIDNDLIFMTVKAVDGNNRGFSFPASGAVQNSQDSGEYGGVVYSYSTNKLRYWLPPLKKINVNGPQGYLIYINDEYGEGNAQQRSLRAEIAIHVWKSNKTCNLPAGVTLPPTTSTTTTTTTTTKPVTTKPTVSNKNLGHTSNRTGDVTRNNSSDGLWSKSTVLAVHIASGILLAILLLVAVIFIILKCKQTKPNDVVPQRNNQRNGTLKIEDFSEDNGPNKL